MTRVIHRLSVGILLLTTLGCGPNYQPSGTYSPQPSAADSPQPSAADSPQPSAAPSTPDNPSSQPTLGLNRTDVPINDPYYQPAPSSPQAPYEEPWPATRPSPPQVQPRPSQPPRPQPPVRAEAPRATTATLAPRYQEILNSHNRHRANHCAAPLQWSSTLAARAQSWADNLKQAGCAFEHSQNSPYGENLYFFAPAGNMTPEQISTGWYDEVQLYDFNNGGFAMSTGHFTQLIWKDTKNLGCGVSMCNGGEIWVCNYDPPGNVRGYYQRKVLPTSCR